MHVCQLTPHFPPIPCGVGDHAARLSAELAARGVTVTALTSRQSQIAPGSAPGGVTVLPLVSHWNFRDLSLLVNTIRRLAPDVLHIQYQAFLYERSAMICLLPLALRLAGVRSAVVTTLHDLQGPYLLPFGSQLSRLAFRRTKVAAPPSLSAAGGVRRLLRSWGWRGVVWLVQGSRRIIVPDEKDRRELAARLPASQARVTAIPVGANVDVTPPPSQRVAELRATLQPAVGETLLAFFGFLGRDKGLETLFTSLAQIKQQGIVGRLVIVGGDDYYGTEEGYRVALEGLAARLGLERDVVWTGYVSAADAAAYLAAADMVVLPYTEGASMRRTTLMAALAYGLPVITTAVQPFPAILSDDGLLTVPPGDPAALAAAIADLAAAPQRRRALGDGARRIALRFSWPVITGQVQEVYASALERAP